MLHCQARKVSTGPDPAMHRGRNPRSACVHTERHAGMKLSSSAAHWNDQCCLPVHKTQVSLSGVPLFSRNTGFHQNHITAAPRVSYAQQERALCPCFFPLYPHLFVVSFANLLPSTTVASSRAPLAGITSEGCYSISEGQHLKKFARSKL